MPEGSSEFIPLNLTAVEHQQLFSEIRRVDGRHIERLAWQIGTNPEVYKEVIQNPYSPSSQAVLSETFPDEMLNDSSEVMRAVALAEPEGAFDRKLKDMSRETRHDIFAKQLDRSADLVVKLKEAMTPKLGKYWEMSHEQIYAELMSIAFETGDPRVIQENYSKEQRRAFRFGIVNFIEDMNVLKAYREQFDSAPKDTLAKVMNRPFTKEPYVTATPIGFIVGVHEDDYEQFADVIDKEKAEFSTGGATVFNRNMPHELWGKIVLINTGGERGGIKNEKDLERTFIHEWNHMLFSSFFNTMNINSRYVGKNVVEQLRTDAHYSEYATILEEYFSNYAQDEIIAYFSSGNEGLLKKAQLGAHRWPKERKVVSDNLNKLDNITTERKKERFEHIQKAMIHYHELVDSYQIIAAELYGKVGKEELTYEKATALLELTPLHKADRLLPYIGYTKEAFNDRLKRRKKAITSQVGYSVNVLTKKHGEREPLGENPAAAFESISDTELGFIQSMHPLEVFPMLKDAIPGINSHHHVDSFLTAAEMILFLHHKQLPRESIEELREALTTMIEKRTDDSFKAERVTAEKLIKTITHEYIPNDSTLELPQAA